MTTPVESPTFTGEPGDEYLPERCRHSKALYCEYCCHVCNYGGHVCACGASVRHHENKCMECRAFAANEKAIAEMESSDADNRRVRPE